MELNNLLILSFTNIKTDPRVYRQICMLKDEYNIVAVGEGDPGIQGIEFMQIKQEKRNTIGKFFAAFNLAFRQYDRFYWSSQKVIDNYNMLKNVDFDVMIANDLDTLPLAVRLSEERNAKLIFDAHEYYPRQFEDNLKWRLLFKRYNFQLSKKYLHRCDEMLTVCKGLADEYEKEFGVKSTIVTNAPDYIDLKPSTVEKKIKIIHHGIANQSRKIENMIYIMDYLEDTFELDLMLVKKSSEYYERLKEMVDKRNNVRLIEPVKMKEIPKFINKYDIGLFLLEPINFNYENALPNKFFEFIQGRLMVAIGPSPQMMNILEKYNLGIVAEDFSPKSLAGKLKDLNVEDINKYKENSDKAARTLSSLANKNIMRKLIKNV